MNLFLNFFICLIIRFINAHTISTPQGDIKGTIIKTINGREIQAFTGIPYGKPPVGDLRFKNPVPFGSWKGVRDGSKDCPLCMQNGENIGIKGIFGSEDCLYLNVFTPNFTIPKKYPVLFYIHGGGFTNGGATFFGPEFLLDKDVILVSINYRLDAFGFASTEDAEMPGNYGLKDQVLALQWVHNNIASYGGNPNSVTIAGHSAGGGSVHYQMISPLSKGLFHRAVPMSGSSHCPWALRAPGVVAKRTKRLASLVGCTAEPSKYMLDCLQQISPKLIIEMSEKFKEWEVDPIIVFTPVVEPKGIEGAFLTVDPHTVKTTIPMMTGITKDEGALRAARVCHGDEVQYLFPAKLYIPNRGSFTGKEKKMLDEMVTLWTNFVIHGNPTPKGYKVVWDKVIPQNMNYLHIESEKSKMETKLFSERDAFWQKLQWRSEIISSPSAINKDEL
ncbi:juvenile hormone esterase-like isoform X4 [Lycorma delicatula]|uniref:juvenile hormone esterase-like isoform X4 n=1 Tax=Lycorma delicatula TaxID=130591 RepID=UPI003F5127E7